MIMLENKPKWLTPDLEKALHRAKHKHMLQHTGLVLVSLGLLLVSLFWGPRWLTAVPGILLMLTSFKLGARNVVLDTAMAVEIIEQDRAVRQLEVMERALEDMFQEEQGNRTLN